jgi:photosystem II stability/assembly factor-like uncharacterized protein
MNRPLIQCTTVALVLICSLTLRAQDRFEQTRGPYGGNIFSAAVSSDGTVYVVTGNNEVVRSENNGATWTRCEPRAVHRVAVDSSGNVYAGFDFGVYRSSDRGVTWSRHVAGTPVPSLNSFTQVYLLEAGSTGTIYLGYNSRLYSSTDRGVTWTEVLVRADRPLVRDIAVGPNGAVYAGIGGGIFRSKNDGVSWSRLDLDMTTSDTVTLLASAPGGEMWARVAPQFDLYYSTNDGESWTRKESFGLPPNTAMRDLTLSPAGTLYAGMESGLYRSTDKGDHWSATGGIGVERNVISAVITTPGGSVFAGASDLYRSTDDGFVWNSSTAGMIATAVFALEEGIDGTILAGTVNNLFRSTDRGQTWTESRSGILENTRINDLVRSGSVLIASTTGAGLYRSTDNGQNWTSGNVGLSSSNIYRVITIDGGTLFAATARGIFRSTNAGVSWSPSSTGIPDVVVRDIANAGGGIFVAATLGAGLYRSSDNGATWVEANSGETEPSINALAISRRGALFAAADHIYRSTDKGASWHRLTFDVATSHVAEMSLDQAGTIYAATHFPVRSTDNGNTWSPHIEIPFLTNTHVRSNLAASDGSFYFGTDGAGVVRLVADNGDRWESLANAPSGARVLISTPAPSSLVGPTTFAFSPAVLYAGTALGIQRSTDEGLSWEILNGPTGPTDPRSLAELTGTDGVQLWVGEGDGVMVLDPVSSQWIPRKQNWPGGAAHALAVVTPQRQVYAATEHGVWIYSDDQWSAVRDGMGDRGIVALQLAHDGSLVAAASDGSLYHSNLARTSWTLVTDGIAAVRMISLAADPSGNIYAGSVENGLFRSTDNGIGWARSADGLPSAPITAVAANSHGVLFAGTSSGTYRSIDGGRTWSLVDAPAGPVADIVVAGNGRIFVAGSGLRRSIAVDGTSGVVSENAPTSDLEISVVENDQGAGALVRYRLAAPGSVEIGLYDQTGRIVRSLFSGDAPKGESRLRVETSGLASGRYFLRMVADAGVASYPLLIVR